MKYSLEALDAAHHISELVRILSRLDTGDVDFLAAAINEDGIPIKASLGLRHLLALTDGDGGRAAKRKGGVPFEEFRFEDVMHRLRNAVMHAPSSANAAELD